MVGDLAWAWSEARDATDRMAKSSLLARSSHYQTGRGQGLKELSDFLKLSKNSDDDSNEGLLVRCVDEEVDVSAFSMVSWGYCSQVS